jgi:Immunoglobulin domain
MKLVASLYALVIGALFFSPLRNNSIGLFSNSFSKPRHSFAGASRILGATFALLLMTACGGGWGSLGLDLPSITKQPANQTVTSGQTGSYSVAATGEGTLTYQWYANGTLIPGATSTTYTTPTTSMSNNGTVYTVQVANSAGNVNSNPANLTVTTGSASVTGPVITSQPVGQTTTAGQTASYSVTATGTTPLTYQWYDNGVAVPGATSSTYTTSATATTDSGSKFTVVVTDAGGSVTSNQAPLTVNAPVVAPPTINNEPSGQTVNTGQTATYSVTASGTGPLTYQWYDNGVPVTGATSSTYTTPSTTGSNSGSIYTVTVSNPGGTATSTPAPLTVNSGPVVTVPPANQTVNTGQTATYSVTATGSGTLTYQWSDNGTPIAGATSSTYTTPPTTTSNSGSVYTVTVSNSVGSASAGPATLTVNSAPVVTVPPANQTVNAGQTATYSVTATGSGTLTYQWSDNGTPIAGATSSTYTTPPTTGSNSGSVYTVTVSNSVGSTPAGPATLTVNTAPVITNQSPNQTVTAGQTTSLNVTATGTGPLTYQWSDNGTPIAGATSSTYTTPPNSSSTSGSVYTVTVSNTVGNTTSVPITITVNTPPTITNQTPSQTVNAGQTGTFSVTATGTGPLTYQWSDNGVPIPGATSSTYTTPATTGSNSGSVYTATVTNTAGTATSVPSTLTVITPPTITTPPASQSVSVGQTASFGVVASGTGPLTYQWYDNGAPIPGATGVTYTTPATVASNNGSLYTVVVSNTAGSATGGPATLGVLVDPLITSPPANQTVTAGQTATFSVTATGTNPISYQWNKNGTPIPGATSSTYTTPATVSSDSGSLFTVTVSNPAGTVTGGPATLTVNTPPSITTQPASQSITVGQTATFNVVAAGTPTLTYQWYQGGVLIPGATGTSYTTPVTTATGTSQYTVTVTNPYGNVTSNPATLTVALGTPVASGLVCTPSSPPYNSAVTIVPSFSGGTAVIGSSGINSSDITALAISASSYTSPLLISTKTYTLTVTGAASATATATCKVTPTQVTITPITPANSTVAPGKQSFNATASGGVTDTLTWTASGGSFSDNVWTSPNTAGTYTITATSVDEPSVHVTTTIIVSAPAITTQPASQNICVSSSATLSVVANYAASYQWNLNGAAIPAANSSSYFIAGATSATAGNYTVTITNLAGSVTSNIAQVVVGTSITSNPVSLAILVGQTATFSVAATGEAPFGYQWYVIAPGGSTGTAIPGATSSTYTTPAATSTNQNGTQFYVTVTDACGVAPLTSTSALLTVTGGNSPPTIITQPVSQTTPVGSTPTFTVVAVGSPTLTYQWYEIPAGSQPGIYTKIAGATSAGYTLPASATNISDDQDGYYVIVTNGYGQATSVTATLGVGAGIVITKQPVNDYVNAGDPATFSVTAASTLPLSYQWYEAPPGSSTFTAIPGATSPTYTQPTTAITDTGSVFYVVVSNGTTTSVTSNSAALFVGALSPVSNLCAWTTVGDAQPPTSSCSIQLVNAQQQQHGEIVWPTLVSTGNIQLSFTVTTSNASNPPADGYALVLGDPSLGATPTSIGLPGEGLGAEGIPGFVLAFDDYYDPPNNSPGFPGDASVPYIAVERGESALWENQYLNTNTGIPALATVGVTVTHNYTVSIVQGFMTVTMDGTQIFSGAVSVPPVAYLYFTGSTGSYYETTVISNLSAAVSAPSN